MHVVLFIAVLLLLPPPRAALAEPLSDAARPPAAVLIERMCTKALRPNEDDRLMGMISIAVRTTIQYRRGMLSPNLIDDATQEAAGATMDACPQLAAAADPQRLGIMIDIIERTTEALLADKTRRYSAQQLAQATAADLSEELSTDEIDAWLGGLPPRQRAMALFLYASDVTPNEAAAAVGLKPSAAGTAFGDAKAGLLHYFRNDAAAPVRVDGKAPAMQITDAGGFAEPLPALLRPTAAAPGTVLPGEPPGLRVTGISSEIYAGWSLLATATGLDHGKRLQIAAPLLLEPDTPGRKRMIVTDAVELSVPGDSPRRFLLKAYAIDPEAPGSGLHDGFHLGAAAIDNAEALQTLRNRRLSSIEIVRCLEHDYGGADPGLCR